MASSLLLQWRSFMTSLVSINAKLGRDWEEVTLSLFFLASSPESKSSILVLSQIFLCAEKPINYQLNDHASYKKKTNDNGSSIWGIDQFSFSQLSLDGEECCCIHWHYKAIIVGTRDGLTTSVPRKSVLTYNHSKIWMKVTFFVNISFQDSPAILFQFIIDFRSLCFPIKREGKKI